MGKSAHYPGERLIAVARWRDGLLLHMRDQAVTKNKAY